MRIAFCGSPSEAAASLQAIVEAGHEVVAVVTRPDRPRGRGRKVQPPAVRREADAHGLRCFQPENANEPAFVSSLGETRPDVLVVVAFGAILRAPLLGLAPRGALNVHFSLLPAYRGAAPVEWALLRGESETGVTTMFMSAEVDAGDIILRRATRIEPDETAGELRERLSRMGGELLVETLALFERGAPIPRLAQDAGRYSRAPRLTPEVAVISWTKSARDLHNLVRALNPRPGAVTTLAAGPLKVWRTRLGEAAERGGGARVDAASEPARRGAPGEILALTEGGPRVACGDGSLVLTELQEPGKQALPGEVFARGRRLRVGDRLGAEGEGVRAGGA